MEAHSLRTVPVQPHSTFTGCMVYLQSGLSPRSFMSQIKWRRCRRFELPLSSIVSGQLPDNACMLFASCEFTAIKYNLIIILFTAHPPILIKSSHGAYHCVTCRRRLIWISEMCSLLRHEPHILVSYQFSLHS